VSFRVRYTEGARNDLVRLYQFLLEKDIDAARWANAAIKKGMELLETFPFTCRKASADNPFLRELIIPYGASGYVALFEIEQQNIVTLLAIRHQREEDLY